MSECYGTGKAGDIRRLWNETPLDRKEIAARLGCSFKYVCVILAVPPGYNAAWMRRKRADPAYAQRERERARKRRRQTMRGEFA